MIGLQIRTIASKVPSKPTNRELKYWVCCIFVSCGCGRCCKHSARVRVCALTLFECVAPLVRLKYDRIELTVFCLHVKQSVGRRRRRRAGLRGNLRRAGTRINHPVLTRSHSLLLVSSRCYWLQAYVYLRTMLS